MFMGANYSTGAVFNATPGKMNSIGPPESRDVNGWCSIQPPSSILVCVGGTANKSSSLFIPSHDCRYTNAILREYVRSCRRRLVGLVRRRGAVRFIRFVGGAVRFIRLPESWVWREDCSSGLFRLLSLFVCSFGRLLDILTSHNVAGYLRTGG